MGILEGNGQTLPDLFFKGAICDNNFLSENALARHPECQHDPSNKNLYSYYRYESDELSQDSSYPVTHAFGDALEEISTDTADLSCVSSSSPELPISKTDDDFSDSISRF